MTGRVGVELGRTAFIDAFDCLLAVLDEEKMMIRAVTTVGALFSKETSPVVEWAWGRSAVDKRREARRITRMMRGRRVARVMRQFDMTEKEAREKLAPVNKGIAKGDYVLPK